MALARPGVPGLPGGSRLAVQRLAAARGGRGRPRLDGGEHVIVPQLCLLAAYLSLPRRLGGEDIDQLITLPQVVVEPLPVPMTAMVGGWAQAGGDDPADVQAVLIATRLGCRVYTTRPAALRRVLMGLGSEDLVRDLTTGWDETPPPQLRD